MKYSICAIFFVGSLFAAGPVEFYYDLEGFPKQSGGCHTVAKEIGIKFAAATGMNDVQAVCLPETSDGWNIRIRYHAEKKIEAISNGGKFPSLAPSGRFPKREECEGALPILIMNLKRRLKRMRFSLSARTCGRQVRARLHGHRE